MALMDSDTAPADLDRIAADRKRSHEVLTSARQRREHILQQLETSRRMQNATQRRRSARRSSGLRGLLERLIVR